MEFICKLEDLDKPINYLKKIIVSYIENSDKENAPVILLNGEMGAGKTTFTRNLIQSFAKEDVNVNSPTFNIFNKYQIGNLLFYHFDLYRIKSSNEVYDLGFEEIWGMQGISIVEWWSRAREMFDTDSIVVDIKIIDSHTRNYKIERLSQIEKNTIL